jgi:hypothetical protein
MLQGGVDKCGRVARAIGHGSLPLGRMLERHVNTPKLIAGFGTALAHAAVLLAGTLIEQHRLGRAGARSRPFLAKELSELGFR